MKAKSLSIFRTKLRYEDKDTVLVNAGDVIEGDDEHLRALARNRLVQLLDDEEPVTPEAPNSPATETEMPEAAAESAAPHAASFEAPETGATRHKAKSYH